MLTVIFLPENVEIHVNTCIYFNKIAYTIQIWCLENDMTKPATIHSLGEQLFTTKVKVNIVES